MKASESDSEIVKEYKTIIQSIRCTITHEYILVIIPWAENSDIDTILQKKITFFCTTILQETIVKYIHSLPKIVLHLII